MPTIFVKDDLRAQVEAASGGAITVLYTAAGHPSYMAVVPKFRMEDIDPSLGTGVCPAFIVNGVEKSELFLGLYPGVVRDGNFLSLPGVIPTVSQNFDYYRAQAANNGPGWHMVTNAEFSALALWCWKNGTMPRGNTNWGQSSDTPFEVGRRGDRALPGTASGDGKTFTGSGPLSWRHNGSPYGIADLCGNVWEWCTGMRIVDGEIQVLPDNDAAASGADVSAGSAAWRAINGATGAFVTPGSANTVKYATSGTANYTLVRTSGQSFEGMTNPGTTPVAEAALQQLRRLGLFPIASSGLGGDGFWVDATGERLPIRGGAWYYGALAGVFALHVYFPRSHVYSAIGSRPAFVI
ncbi:hypothetical protein [Chrysiogenes arsenatis]|uniref:hypothetical protein n=1 Tax=Chrysiogenes arsenatis TaxID=309797 RepID=UPI000408F5A1|nr:hypothetical protein [Chrysiogenes arsenatis]